MASTYDRYRQNHAYGGSRVKKFDYGNYANNLPDCYAKDELSNNYKILLIEHLSLNGKTENGQVLKEGLQIDIADIDNALDLNTATGKTLDLYGEMVGQARGTANDAQYRMLIKSKILQNKTGGNFPSVLNAIYVTFGCKPSDISIVESETPCMVRIDGMPYSEIIEADMTTSQVVAIIKRLLPAGVGIETAEFEGTFEFSENEKEASTTAGFADNEQTMGGYFGYIASENEEQILPTD